MVHDIQIIGGGLAGSEAAWQLARRGFRVRLSEMRGSGEMTPAHQTDGLAELVCSNSFRSDDSDKNAVGLLHDEMRRLDSLVMQAGEKARVPAGSAMAVDRDVFSAEVERALKEHPNVTVVRERVDALPESGPTIVATGPLTAQSLAESIVQATGQDRLAFFDAIAPIVHRDSIDMDICWIQSRWNKRTEASNEEGDYINCPMTKEQYYAFHQGLMDGEKTEFREWEKDTPYFEGCMPIEVMAERALLAGLGGSCHSPVAALSRIEGEELVLRAAIYSAEGAIRIEDEARMARDDREGPRILAETLLKEAPEQVRALFEGAA